MVVTAINLDCTKDVLRPSSEFLSASQMLGHQYGALRCCEGEWHHAFVAKVVSCNRLLLRLPEAYNNRRYSLFFGHEENLSAECLRSPQSSHKDLSSWQVCFGLDWRGFPFLLTTPCSLVLIQGCSDGFMFHPKWEYGAKTLPLPAHSESGSFYIHPDGQGFVLMYGDDGPIGRYFTIS